MKKIIVQFLVLSVVPLMVFTQDDKRNPYNLNITGSIAEYKGECSKNKQNQLIDLAKAIPSIRLDIRYATSNNFTHKQVYSSARAFLREPAATALANVQKELEKQGLVNISGHKICQ